MEFSLEGAIFTVRRPWVLQLVDRL
jgi:hypothetical protein